MAAKLAGAVTIVAVDRHASRLELARKYGATHVISGDVESLSQAVREATEGGADYALDTTGNAAVARALFDGLNNTGALALAGV